VASCKKSLPRPLFKNSHHARLAVSISQDLQPSPVLFATTPCRTKTVVQVAEA
jgi:hypothetical protein